MLRLVILCNWLLMVMIITLADQSGELNFGGLNLVGLLKIGSRLGVLGLLAYLVLQLWPDARRSATVKQVLPWCCFGLWAITSTLWSALRSFSFGQALSWGIMVMLAFCTAMLARRLADVSRILLHLCLALLLAISVVLASQLLAPENLSRTGGAKGLFHPTNASATAGLGIVLIAWARMSFGWTWSQWLWWPSLAIYGAELYLAHNRASLGVTFLVASGIVLLQSSPGWRWLLLTVGSTTCAVYVTLDPGFSMLNQAGGGIAQYVLREQSGQQLAALSGREEMWGTIWNSYLQSPWLGHGYAVSSATGELKVWYEWSNWTAHNFWLQVLVSTGIVGAALMAWALIGHAVRMAHCRNQGAGLRRLTLLGAAVLLWQIGWGLTNESFVGPLQPESIVYFVVVGLVIGRMVCGAARAAVQREIAPIAARLNPSFPVPTTVPLSY